MWSQLKIRNFASFLMDAVLFILLSLFLYRHSSFSWVGILWLPLLITLFFRFFLSHLWGSTPGFSLFQIKRVHQTHGKKVSRLFDWVFESKLELDPHAKLFLSLGTSFVILLFSWCASLYIAWEKLQKDPAYFPFPQTTLPLFSPAKESPDWGVFAFFYASGAWPIHYENHPVLYTLPYAKGPPQKFIGQINIEWDLAHSRLSLRGPLTLGDLKSRDELKNCFIRKWKCTSLRKKLIQRTFKKFFDEAQLESATWFEVDNPTLSHESQPQGLYFSGISKQSTKDQPIRIEAYYLVNAQLAIQGIHLETRLKEHQEKNSDLLRKIIGSQRLEDDLKAPRVWANSQLSKIQLTEKSPVRDLIRTQAFLISKASVDPQSFENFYHLGGVSLKLFEQGRIAHEIEWTSTAKQNVLSAYLYARDIDPKNPNLTQLETFKAEIKKMSN